MPFWYAGTGAAVVRQNAKLDVLLSMSMINAPGRIDGAWVMGGMIGVTK
jgi:hypothetical protein